MRINVREKIMNVLQLPVPYTLTAVFFAPQKSGYGP